MLGIGPMAEVHAEARRQELLLESRRARRMPELNGRSRGTVRTTIGTRMVRLGFWISGRQRG